MVFFQLALAVLVFSCIKIAPKDCFFEDCLSKPATMPIKGMFILWIVICHSLLSLSVMGYEFSGFWDKVFWGLCAAPRQLTVVMFLFYSGYGVMEAIRAKGDAYVKSIPMRRVLRTFVNFNIAVLVYFIVNLCIGRSMDVRQVLLSIVCWDSLGNSNWYIFAILVCYSSAFLVFRLIENRTVAAFLLVVLLAMYAVVISFWRETWWYDTVLTFSAGIIFAMGKEDFLSVFRRKYNVLMPVFVVCVVILHAIPISSVGSVVNVKSAFFAMVVVMLTMKVRFNSRFLAWAGENLFLIYIYQGIPMLLMRTLFPTFSMSFPFVFLAVVFTGTFVLVCVYRKCEGGLRSVFPY